jgi:hypothetical protein
MDDATRLVRRQLGLALRVAGVFVVVLLLLPLLAATLRTDVAGFPLGWLLVGVLFYPFAWALARWFAHGSDRMEDEA